MQLPPTIPEGIVYQMSLNTKNATYKKKVIQAVRIVAHHKMRIHKVTGAYGGGGYATPGNRRYAMAAAEPANGVWHAHRGENPGSNNGKNVANAR